MKELYGYTYLRRGYEEGAWELSYLILLGISLSLFITITSIIYNVIFFTILFGVTTLMLFVSLLKNKKRIEYVEYINSEGKIKRIYEKDWKNEKLD